MIKFKFINSRKELLRHFTNLGIDIKTSFFGFEKLHEVSGLPGREACCMNRISEHFMLDACRLSDGLFDQFRHVHKATCISSDFIMQITGDAISDKQPTSIGEQLDEPHQDHQGDDDADRDHDDKL